MSISLCPITCLMPPNNSIFLSDDHPIILMKQPQTSSTVSKTPRWPFLPSLKNSKQSPQEIQATMKSQVFLHKRILPLDILLDDGNRKLTKVTVNSEEVVIQSSMQLSRKSLKSVKYEWLGLNFGNTFSRVTIRTNFKETVFKNIFWDPNSIKQTECYVLHLKMIGKQNHKMTIPNQQETKQHTINIGGVQINKKQRRNLMDKHSISIKKIKYRKLSGISSNKLNSHLEIHKNSKFTINELESKRILSSRNKQLMQSKFTKKSEKQTNDGELSGLALKNNLHFNSCADYMKQKSKFDSQPYFQNTGSFKRSIAGIKSINNICSVNKLIEHQTCNDFLQNKSEHESEEEAIEEEIKRSRLTESMNSFYEGSNRRKKQEESSACCVSKELESSGSLYESKYQ